jgi:hypothetical protein
MSERKRPAVNRLSGLGHSPVHALVHAGEVAQWSVVLLGWLWLGEQGMRLGCAAAQSRPCVGLGISPGLDGTFGFADRVGRLVA